MVRTSSITTPSIVGIVRRAPAVDEQEVKVFDKKRLTGGPFPG